MIGLVFTPEQFKTMLRMIYIANTVANGHREGDFIKEYDDLEQYIFSRAEGAGFPAATWRHKVEGEEHHHPSLMFENDPELSKLLDDYELAATLDTLAGELAEREIEAKHGPRAKDRMPAKDYDTLLQAEASQYLEILEQKGFRCINVNKD
jgi:hypothetical protein